jgi:hypothetical protein
MPSSSQRQDADEHRPQGSDSAAFSCFFGCLGGNGMPWPSVSCIAVLKHAQSCPTMQVSQLAPPLLGAGDANCCWRLVVSSTGISRFVPLATVARNMFNSSSILSICSLNSSFSFSNSTTRFAFRSRNAFCAARFCACRFYSETELGTYRWRDIIRSFPAWFLPRRQDPRLAKCAIGNNFGKRVGLCRW